MCGNAPAMSWSAISSFEWQPSGWHQKYVVHGKCTRDNMEKGTESFCVVSGFPDPSCPVVKKTPELIFGSYVDKKIQEDRKFLPKLVRYPILQHEMTGTFDNIPLLGYADTFRAPTEVVMGKKKVKTDFKFDVLKPAIRDYKTGRKPWDQKRADETGQLAMYLFMLYLRDKIQPEHVECYIDWLPTHIEDGKVAFIKKGDIRTFKTKRSMHQVLIFGQRIKDTWAAMEEYAGREAGMEVHDAADW